MVCVSQSHAYQRCFKNLPIDCDLYDDFNNYIGPELDSDESGDEDNTQEEREHSEGMVRFSCNNI